MGQGQALAVPGPDGNQYQVIVPPGVGPGGLFEAEIPLPPRQSVPMGAPVRPSAYSQPHAAPVVVQQVQPVVVQQPPRVVDQIVVYNSDASPAEIKQRLMPDSIDESKLILLAGLCCVNTSVYGCSNGCFGVAAKAGFCCLEAELCLKLNTPRLACCCCALRCIDSRSATCVKGQVQTCCLVHSFAFPPDEEVPCTLAICFLACCPRCGCCSTLGDLTSERQTIAVRTQSIVR